MPQRRIRIAAVVVLVFMATSGILYGIVAGIRNLSKDTDDASDPENSQGDGVIDGIGPTGRPTNRPTSRATSAPTGLPTSIPTMPPKSPPTSIPTKPPMSPPTSIPTTPPTMNLQVGTDLDGEAADDRFGASLAISFDGTRIAIGAPRNDGNGDEAGHVRIYDWTGSRWTQVGSDLDGEAPGDTFGYSVALSADGNRVAIGADWNGGNGDKAGHVRIYDLIEGQWTQVGSDLDGEAAGDGSGWKVSLSADGNRVAIGANWNDGNGEDAGHVRIFDWTGSEWLQVGADLDGAAAKDGSGTGLALSSQGNRVAIGAPGDDSNGSNSGNVRIYEWTGSEWLQLGSDLDGEAARDEFGLSIALSSDGNRVAIGSPYNDGTGDTAGHVRIYDWTGSFWTQVGDDLDGEAAGDEFGWSLAISSDGNRLVVGATDNDGTGVNAGHVRLYDWTGSEWLQVGSDMNAEAAGDEFGWSVALSADGSRVAIGARWSDGNGVDAGQVVIYDLTFS